VLQHLLQQRRIIRRGREVEGMHAKKEFRLCVNEAKLNAGRLVRVRSPPDRDRFTMVISLRLALDSGRELTLVYCPLVDARLD
jgi:hypothetical protein